jgi:cation:H+ antiporter
MTDYLMLLLTLVIILLGAAVFTNGLEWFGKKLNLTDGAVGSIFAAVGTALPETLVPIVAIIFGSKEAGHAIGIGAIIGAPFMLGTLAFFIAGVAVIVNRKKRPDFPVMRVEVWVIKRDLEFFLAVYIIAIISSFLNHPILKLFIAVGLALAYAVYVFRTLKGNGEELIQESDIDPCYFAPKSHDPHFAIILAQVAFSLFLIVWGAYIFVEKIQAVSIHLGISAFILSLIIAPIATELPEKFNSVIWIRKGKDTLAIGNITGAMVFQSSMITAIGILMTEWRLSHAAFLTALLTLSSTGLAYWQIRRQNKLTPYTLLAGGFFYLLFVALVFTGKI